jgi:zinc protease
MARVARDGFTAEEIEAAKSGWLQQRTVSRSNDRELAGTLAARAYEGRDLKWDAAFEAAVAALTPEQIHTAVMRFLDPTRLSVVFAGDFAKARTEKPGTGAAAEKPENAGGGR